MLKKTALVISLVCFSLSVKAVTVDELVKKNIQARGGLKNMLAIKSVKMTGKITSGPMEMPMTLYWSRPGKLRMEMSLQGQNIVQAFDGKIGWMIMPMMGSSEPQKMPKDELDEIKTQAEEMIEGPLVDYKKKGHQVELLGKEDMQGTETYKLRIKLKSGKERTYYLDVDSGIDLKTTEKIKRQGIEVVQHSYLGDYQKVGGVMVPHTIDTKGADGHGAQITIEKVEINPKLKADLYTLPKKQEVKKEKTEKKKTK